MDLKRLRTFVAVAGPAFDAVRTYVRMPPGATVAGPDLITERSAGQETCVATSGLWLLERLTSCSGAATDARFTMVESQETACERRKAPVKDKDCPA